MKKLLALVLTLCLMLPLFGTASAELEGGTVITATPELYSGIDLSSAYTVKMYLVGDKPTDWDKIEEKVNEYLKPYNTAITTTFLSWDYSTMYSLSLTGNDVDLIFTAPWAMMYTEAAKGSFLVLTDEFIEKAMPLTKQYQAPASWSETTMGGNVIAVSSNVAQPMGKMVAIRQDIADKLGVKTPTNWAEYKEFMLAVAEKETPESGVYAMASAGDNNELWDVYREQFDTMLLLDADFLDFIYSYDGKTLPTKEDVKLVYETDWFRQYAYDMKEMADAGCWSRSALTNTITDDDAFANLQGASIAWNASVFNYMKQAEKTEGVTCTACDIISDHFVGAEAYSNNDMAIAAGSQNPERAGMVLDLMKFDTYLNHLILLGIEGEHYKMVDDKGHYEVIPENSPNYAPLNAAVCWAIKNGDLEQAGAPEREQAVSDAWQARVMNNPTVSFVFNSDVISAYYAAVKAQLDAYVPMLELGLVEDVDSTLAEMIQKCYDNGLQQVYDELFAQYDAWYATR